MAKATQPATPEGQPIADAPAAEKPKRTRKLATEATAAQASEQAAEKSAKAKAPARASRAKTAEPSAAAGKPKAAKAAATGTRSAKAKSPADPAATPKPRSRKAAAAVPVDAPSADAAPAIAEPETLAAPALPARHAAEPGATDAVVADAGNPGSDTQAASSFEADRQDTAPQAAAPVSQADAPVTEATAASPLAQDEQSPSQDTKPASARPASADKPWLASYPPNVPAEIPGLPADTLGDLMVTACQRFGSRTAFTCMNRDMSFAEVDEASAAFGAYLQSLGLRKGARVALMMPNILQYPVALMGTLRAGYTVVNVNPLYTARELEHQLKDGGVEAIVILENFAHTLQGIVSNTPVRHVIVAALGDMLGLKGFAVNLVVRRVRKMVPKWTLKGHVTFNTALKGGRSAKLKPVSVSSQDLAFLQYTGGTTGVSKGAMLSHANVLANIAQNAAWLESAYLKRSRPDKPIYVCALPLYHIYALTVNALMGMQQGAQNVLITNPRDIPAFVKELSRYKINVLPGLNTLFNALLNNKDFHKLDFSALLLTFGGGMAVQKSVAERWQTLTGCVVAEGYGLSETSPVAVANRFDADQFSGTIGLPLPSTIISIRDEHGDEVALGEAGEICIHGPQVMGGYWNRPDETAKVMTSDGFLKSGDIGIMDERGYTKIVDRKKDMILVSGFNVYPNEIEEVVVRHPKVLEAAAVGVPDEKSGEVPKLFVVKRDETLTEEELRTFCRENLTGYKRPRQIEFRDALPKTNVGKILRRELRS